MAKNSYVKGKTINDLLNLDFPTFMKLTKSELRQVVQRLASAGNKRLNTLAKVSYSPARQGAIKSGGAFMTRGKDANQLRAEYIRAKNFFADVTSTVRGAKTAKEQIIASMAKNGITIEDEDFDRVFKAYDKIRDLDPLMGEEEFKYIAFEEVNREVKRTDLSSEDIAIALQERLREIYESRRKLERGGDVSKFFEF